jgi:hypothetical protein
MCLTPYSIGANAQAGAVLRQSQSYQNVSRETLWYDWGQKPYKASDSGFSCGLVRSANVLLHLQEGGDGAAMARHVADS